VAGEVEALAGGVDLVDDRGSAAAASVAWGVGRRGAECGQKKAPPAGAEGAKGSTGAG
jgi:hypothetical protein